METLIEQDRRCEEASDETIPTRPQAVPHDLACGARDGVASAARQSPRRPCRLIATTLAAVLAVALAGCGYKAPLYVPKPKADERKAPVIVLPEPAPERPVPSESAPAPK